MPNTSLIKFTPDNATRLMPLVRQLVQTKGSPIIFEDELDTTQLTTSCLEGEMAFALAVASHQHLADVIQACQTALLTRLGLSDTPLNAAQSRQRGWIIGLFGALATSVDTD